MKNFLNCLHEKYAKICFSLLFILVFSAFSTRAQYATLLSFDGAPRNPTPSQEGNGIGAYSNLTVSGNMLYGMTISGGTHNEGHIFCVNADGSGYKDLHDFAAGNNDVAQPAGALTLSANGKVLYGMSGKGGQNNYGGIFSINADGSGYTILYSFNYYSTGGNGFGTLTRSGNLLYGINKGGANGYGCIFSFDLTTHTYTDLFNFNGKDGWPGNVNSLMVSNGILYGMTEYGGAKGDGTVFSFDIESQNFASLLDFNGDNGSHPRGSLAISNGVLYGMTSEGGANKSGLIFSIKTDGSNYLKLLDFGGSNEGVNPTGSLIVSNNILYGMTPFKGSKGNNNGIIFSLNADGSNFTQLFDFNASGAANPQGALTLLGNTLYGMTEKGGDAGNGTIFSMNMATSVNQLNDNAVSANVYPNPSNGMFNIALSTLPASQAYLQIYNSIGESVYQKTLEHVQNSAIQMYNQADGVYMYRVTDESGNILSQGKLIISK